MVIYDRRDTMPPAVIQSSVIPQANQPTPAIGLILAALTALNVKNAAIEKSRSLQVRIVVRDTEVTVAGFVRNFLEHDNQKYLYLLCTPSTNGVKSDTVLHYGNGVSTRILIAPEEWKEYKPVVGHIMMDMKVKGVRENEFSSVLGRGKQDTLSCIFALCSLNVECHVYTD